VIIQLDLKPFVPQASALLWVEQELWVEQALWIEVSQLLLSDETFLALYEFQPPSFDPPPSLHVLSLLLLSAAGIQKSPVLPINNGLSALDLLILSSTAWIIITQEGLQRIQSYIFPLP
jgi:hypothetical protein